MTALPTLLVAYDGTSTVTPLTADADGSTLYAMYGALGVNFVDVVSVSPALDCWIDDEGRLNGSPVNLVASAMVMTLSGRDIGAPLCGPVLFTGAPDRSGDVTGLAEEVIGDLTGLAGSYRAYLGQAAATGTPS